MSQDQNDNNNNTNRPLVIRHSPPRATLKRTFIPYENPQRPNRSPSNVLRMISRLPHRSIPEPPVIPEIQRFKSPPPPPPPIRRGHIDSYTEFKQQYMKIKRVDPESRPGVQLDYIHKKARHLDTLSEALSDVTFRTTANYSQLDYLPPPPPLPLQQQLPEIQYHIEDDARSLATQDMLLDEDDGQVVLDSQQILELRRKVELMQPSSMPLEQTQTQPSIVPFEREQSSIPFLEEEELQPSKERHQSQPPRKPLQKQPSSIPLEELQPPNNQHIPSLPKETSKTPSIASLESIKPPKLIKKKDKEKDKGKERETTVEKSPPPFTNEIQEKDEMDLDNIGSDWGMDEAEYGGDDWQYEEEQAINESDTRNLVTGTRIVKRIVPGASSINVGPQSSTLRRPLGCKFIRDRFSNKLNFNTKLVAGLSIFDKVWDAYADQMGDDLKAYIEHRKNNHENDKTLLKEDVILLMKRQRVINEQNSLESIAYKHLPRESWDILCTSALKNNVLCPPSRNAILTSTFDNNSDNDEEEDDETVSSHFHSQHIDFD